MTLRARFAAVTAVAVAVVVVALAAGVYLAARAELRSQIDEALNERARAFADGRRGPQGPPGEREPGSAPAEGGAAREDGTEEPPPVPFGGAPGAFQLIQPDGSTRQPAGETAGLPVDDRAREIARTGQGRESSEATVDGVHLRILTVGAGDRGAVQVARPLTEVDEALDRLLIIVAVLGALGVALAAVLGALLARTALKPVTRFTQRTEAIVGDPDLSHRLEVQGTDELARLARSFNEALSALERSVEAQRHLVADASHELRTPMASLRANIQILDQAGSLPPEERVALRDDIISELDGLTALVGDIVELARGTAPSEDEDDVRLDAVASALVERYTRRAGNGVSFDTSFDESVVRGDPARIARAVSNLIDNAVKWTGPGTTVEVRVRDGELTVRDHGPGFDPEDLPHVFDRFYRSTTARGKPGSGLGLAIVRQTAEAHGGTATAENAPDGGAIVSVRFAPA